MGNNSSLITVTFDRTQPTIYSAGDIISGHVQFTVSERTNKVDEICLIITGDVGHTTVRTARIQNGQTERITDCHDVRIFGKKLLLGRPTCRQQQNGQASGRLNDIEMTTVEPGQYKYPFAIRLPEVLPPTIHPEDYPFVRYQLQVLIEKKWYASNNCHCYPIRVHPRVNLLQISNSQCAVKFDSKRKDITIKGVLQRSGLVPGEQTILALEIINPNRLSIRRVDVCLIQRYEIEQCRRRSELIRLFVPQLLNTSDEHIETTCPITIPLGIPPTYNFQSKGTDSAVHVDLHYDLKLEVKAKGLFSDFELQVPILIGTDSAEHSSHDPMSPSSSSQLNTIDMLDFEVNNEHIHPPSYTSLYCEDKDSNLY